jgi:hypothetical protein
LQVWTSPKSVAEWEDLFGKSLAGAGPGGESAESGLRVGHVATFFAVAVATVTTWIPPARETCKRISQGLPKLRCMLASCSAFA